MHVRLAPLGRPARTAAVAIPVAFVVVGLTVAVVAAVLAERPGTEAVGTLGVEAGAALWFGGAVALSLRSSTARHEQLVLATAVAGAALIALALLLQWSGAALSLAMELGVGALAIVVIDVIVLGRIQPGLDELGRVAPTSTLDVDVAWAWPPVAVRIQQGDGLGRTEGDGERVP